MLANLFIFLINLNMENILLSIKYDFLLIFYNVSNFFYIKNTGKHIRLNLKLNYQHFTVKKKKKYFVI